MILKVETAANGVFVQNVENSREAVAFLRELAAEGIKCIRWTVI